MGTRRWVAASAVAVALVLLASPALAWAADSDGDGVADSVDICNNTPAGTPVDFDGRPRGDMDWDCDMDLDDMAMFQLGFTGPYESLDGVIRMVPVGHPGNAGDPTNGGYGRVNYVYAIGKYEITARQYTAFLNAVACTDTYKLYDPSMWSEAYGCKIRRGGLPGHYFYGVAGDWADRPVNYVSWGDAARFANWLHNGRPTGDQDLTTTEDGSYHLDGAKTDAELLAVAREPDATWVIPSGHEWYKAAYYIEVPGIYYYFDYPTASDTPPSNVLVDPDPGNNATFKPSGGEATVGSPYFRTRVGAHENSASFYGTFDQGGNVFEWIEDTGFSGLRGVRGGAFLGGVRYLESEYRSGDYPSRGIHISGFRVARVP